MFNHATGETFWEAKRVGDRYEQYMAPNGKLFYLNTATSEVSFDGPLHSKSEAQRAKKRRESIERFKNLDRDGNGNLDMDEIMAGAEILKLTQEEAKAWFIELDVDNSGFVSALEFLDKYRKCNGKEQHATRLMWRRGDFGFRITYFVRLRCFLDRAIDGHRLSLTMA